MEPHRKRDECQKTRRGNCGGLRWTICVACALIIVAGWVAWSPSLDGELLNWDDDRNFAQNTAYRGIGARQLRWAWSTFHLGVWQPVSWVLLGLQYEAGERFFADGLNPTVYRHASLVMHLVNAGVFAILAAAVLREGDRGLPKENEATRLWAAVAASFLFVAHPLRGEAVCWISCQPYLPAALFSMLTVLAYLRRHHAERASQKWFWYVVVLVLYALAVGSKAVAVSLPVVLLLLDWYPLRRFSSRETRHDRDATQQPNRPAQPLGQQRDSLLSNCTLMRRWAGAVVEKVPLFLVAAVVSIWATQAKDYNESRSPLSEFEPNARLAQAAWAAGFYPLKTIWPTGLSAYYRLPEDLSLWQGKYGGALAAVAAATVVLFGLRRRCPGCLAAWLAYLVLVLPNLGLVQISQQLAADRYSYLSTLPLFILLAGVIPVVKRRWPTPRTVALLFAGVAVFLVTWLPVARRQAVTWRDSVSLWSEAVRLDPACAVSRCQLGIAYLTTQNYTEASRHLSASIDLQPDFGFAWANLGGLFLHLDRPDDAIAAYLTALRSDSPPRGLDRAKVHAGLGAAYLARGDLDNARQQAHEAEKLDPELAAKLMHHLNGGSHGRLP